MLKNSFFVSLLLLSPLIANSTEKGKSLYFQKGCANCHGTQAEGSGIYPRLANKRMAFIVRKLTEFKAGKATSQTAEMMFSFTSGLSKQEIQDVSLYLSKFKKDTSTKYKISEDILGSVD